MLSSKASKEFQELWKEEFGEELSDTIATDKAVKLLTLFDAVYRPITKEELLNKQYEQKKLE